MNPSNPHIFLGWKSGRLCVDCFDVLGNCYDDEKSDTEVWGDDPGPGDMIAAIERTGNFELKTKFLQKKAEWNKMNLSCTQIGKSVVPVVLASSSGNGEHVECRDGYDQECQSSFNWGAALFSLFFFLNFECPNLIC